MKKFAKPASEPHLAMTCQTFLFPSAWSLPQPRSSIMSTVGRVTYPMPLPLTPALQPGATKHPKNLKPFPTVSRPGQPSANQPRCAAESEASVANTTRPAKHNFKSAKNELTRFRNGGTQDRHDSNESRARFFPAIRQKHKKDTRKKLWGYALDAC